MQFKTLSALTGCGLTARHAPCAMIDRSIVCGRFLHGVNYRVAASVQLAADRIPRSPTKISANSSRHESRHSSVVDTW